VTYTSNVAVALARHVDHLFAEETALVGNGGLEPLLKEKEAQLASEIEKLNQKLDNMIKRGKSRFGFWGIYTEEQEDERNEIKVKIAKLRRLKANRDENVVHILKKM
jgi:hypothetical protein